MKSFKSFITEKLKITHNNPTNSIKGADLVHISDMLSDYIEILSHQNDEVIENIIDELNHNTVYDYLSNLDNSIEEFIDFCNNNSVKKYSKVELETILIDYDKDLTEIVLLDLNRKFVQ